MFRFLKILVFLVVLINSLPANGQTVPRHVLFDKANTFMAENFPGGARKIKSEIPLLYDNLKIFSLLELEPEGWILLASDTKVEPVLGFSFTGHFIRPEENSNSPIFKWFNMYHKQIKQIINDESLRVHSAWSVNQKSGDLDQKSVSGVKVDPFINVTWDQGKNWNQFCPADIDGPGGHAYVGCVAVSMAQAMSVFRTPEMGQDYYSYSHPTYGTQYANFGNTYYNWDSMSYAKADKFNSLLLYHCAVAVNMDFGPDGSGTQTAYSAAALRKYFLFSQNILYKKRTGTDAEWHNQLNEQLLKGRPIIYAGDANDGKPGHAFNIDGVTNSKYYHINWGWSGNNNGYFILDALNPGSNNFSENQAAVFGIQPFYYPTNILLTDTIVEEDMPKGIFIGKVNVIDEATDNTYSLNLLCDSVYDGTQWVKDYFLDGDSLKTGRIFTSTDDRTDTISISLKDRYNNELTRKIALSVKGTLTGFPLSVDNQNDYFVLYPNPATDRLFLLQKTQRDVLYIRIFSLSGNLIKYIVNPDIKNGIQVSSLNPGLYILEAELENQKLIRKRFIIQ